MQDSSHRRSTIALQGRTGWIYHSAVVTVRYCLQSSQRLNCLHIFTAHLSTLRRVDYLITGLGHATVIGMNALTPQPKDMVATFIVEWMPHQQDIYRNKVSDRVAGNSSMNKRDNGTTSLSFLGRAIREHKTLNRREDWEATYYRGSFTGLITHLGEPWMQVN